ncbi:hypothetical protein HN446_03845 [bacterium]|nr:hypothetical protein [bacterium]
MKKLKFLFLALLIGLPLCVDATKKKGDKKIAAATRHGKRGSGKGSPRKDRKAERRLSKKAAAAEARAASGRGKDGDMEHVVDRYAE